VKRAGSSIFDMKRREFLTLIVGSVACDSCSDSRQSDGVIPVPTPRASATVPPSLPVISSAGVFDSTGNLVRTLWAAQTNDPRVNNPAAAWNGLLDNGTVAPTGTYTIQMLNHNVSYVWEGTIGNTSPDHTGLSSYHNYATTVRDMTVTNAGEIYFCHGYDERYNTMHVITPPSSIQAAQYIRGIRDPSNDPISIDSDENVCYINRWPQSGNFSWVWGVSTAPFSYPNNNPGVKQVFNFGNSPYVVTDSSGIPTVGNGPALYFITDMAVQRTGTFLLLIRFENPGAGPNGIYVLDKGTGQPIFHNTNATLGYNQLARISAGPLDNTVWVTYNSGSGSNRDKIAKLTVSVGGVTTETGVFITGLSDIQDIAVSRDGTTLLVMDGGTSQQIKAFNTSDGSVKTAWANSGTLGVLGGYANSPTVTDNKFMFYTNHWFSDGGAYIACCSDGSFWIGDGGNYRNLHFSSGNSPTVIERFAYHPSFYACQVCRNDSTRVFGDYLEYQIDYSKPLTPTSGAWTLLNNWGFGFNASGGNQYGAMRWVGTYSNGRTYAFENISGLWQCFELTASGRRSTAKVFSMVAMSITT
jgi:hypothetical protein